ncbi:MULTISPECIES: hypothetical protein [Micromonospora]|uniref:Integral membrane protein n=1 Tax=Micromonospora solifontis TaxID=2487138 RepID=A0ABX9WMR7_9ACTN|nr:MULTISPECIES: hypothetical protein [Micromonospora]NES13347.1 hypothetical protein [Micromonospora sp. PPF5-17B]NES34716.1 hypothetical protein [Micromonospora solifontis]NES57232.1 hypothetical protein [Micromonospora sp. PPF5-6]RNM01953.1 hypothetical protein EFE23_00835 [Micromonospora solifontis]
MFEKISSWRMKFFLWVGLPVIAVLGVAFAAPDVAPAWRAKSGAGTPGTFTAVREECGKRSCTWHGDFVPTDGGAARRDVILFDDPAGLTTGGTAAARDTGAGKGVFATTGGNTWLLVTGFTVGGALAAVAWVVLIVRTVLGRRRPDEDEAAIDRLARKPVQG